MNEYMYFGLGIILGLAIALYLWASREEKLEKKFKFNQRVFSTKKLDCTLKNITERIGNSVNELKRELTEDEKNEIIAQCYKEKF